MLHRQLDKKSPRIEKRSQVFHSGIESHKYLFMQLLVLQMLTIFHEPNIQE